MGGKWSILVVVSMEHIGGVRLCVYLHDDHRLMVDGRHKTLSACRIHTKLSSQFESSQCGGGRITLVGERRDYELS